MRSVIHPVLPPGFEFAIVDQDGKVQFHSDTQRNVHENLLLETDRNARLQSLLMARGEGSLNTSYWGRPYRAYVKPTVIPGWSIVTLHDKQHTRPLVLEWTAAALSIQAVYMAGWIVAMLLVLWRGGSWLWPDPLRRPWYGPIAVVCVAALVLWAVVAARSEAITTAIVGVAVPIVVWLVTYLLLATRPPGVGGVKAWSELCRDYRLAGALLLVVSSMVPAAAFFALSYDLHIEAHLKQRQIALAQEVDRKQPCSEGGFQNSPGSTLVRYDKVFYGSSPTCAQAPHKEAETTRVWDVIHAKLEELLPDYTSASIALRELMHHESGDESWSSDRTDPSRLAVTVRARQPNYQMAVVSPFPAFVGIRTLQGEPATVLVTIIALALLVIPVLAAFGIMSLPAAARGAGRRRRTGPAQSQGRDLRRTARAPGLRQSDGEGRSPGRCLSSSGSRPSRRRRTWRRRGGGLAPPSVKWRRFSASRFRTSTSGPRMSGCCGASWG